MVFSARELNCTLLQHFAYHKVSVGWFFYFLFFLFLVLIRFEPPILLVQVASMSPIDIFLICIHCCTGGQWCFCILNLLISCLYICFFPISAFWIPFALRLSLYLRIFILSHVCVDRIEKSRLCSGLSILAGLN